MSGVRDRESYEKEEGERLAPYARKSRESRGRVFPEREHGYRTAFQRDRDRVVHSRAFRRLEYKTQVFIYHEGDHYRNRLTHTLEGAQIARTIARSLRLNEDLAEAVVLAHDLGHTPFGHAGERALDELMRDDGGFDHNRQSLRIVDWVEERYPDFRGLNLTGETRAGILKHGCDWPHPVALPRLGRQPSLEAQVADAADEIAYANHDLDDGLRSGLLREGQLEAVPLWREALREATERHSQAPERVRRAQTIVRLINRLVTDLIEATAARLESDPVSSAEEVEDSETAWVGFSPELAREFQALKAFQREHLYQHPHVLRMSQRGAEVLAALYRFYRGKPERLPERVRARFEEEGEARAVADYVAGMTDRFALAEYERWIERT